MSEVTIITPKSNRDAVIEKLRGRVHLKDFEVENSRKLYPYVHQIEETMGKLERIVDQLKPEGKSKKSASPIIDAEEVAIEVETRLSIIEAKKRGIDKEVKKLKTMIELIDTEQFIGRVQILSETQEKWEIEREELRGKNARIIATRMIDNEVIALTKGTEMGLVGDYNSIRGSLINEIKKKRKELTEFDTETQRIKEEYGPRLNTLKKQLGSELKVLTEKRKLTHSELLTFMRGWVPDKGLDAVKSLPDTIVLAEDAGEDAPTKLDNPWFFKPFENFMYIFALPRYGEIDPTVFISIFFPLFYGVMISDAGYGMLLLVTAFALRQKARTLSELLILPAFVTILFGVFFDSYFGFSIGKALINPLTRPFDLLYYAAVIGVFYVDLGLVVGMIQNLLRDQYKEALTQQISLLLFQFGIAVSFFYPVIGVPMMLIGLGLKVKADGVRGFISLPGLVSSILSFSRLAAYALSTVWIGFTINFLARLLIDMHGFGIIPALLIIILGHTMDFTFNAFGGFISALRLHYVEFMGLFFTAKGKPFTPLGE